MIEMKSKKILIFVFLIISTTLCAQKEYGIWEVKEGRVIGNDSANFSMAEDYWQTIHHILPSDLIDKYIVSLRLFTDGIDKDMGGLNQMDKTVEYWQFDLDTEDMDLLTSDSIKILNYTHTLIHEFGHLLTLNSTQIELTDDNYQSEGKGYLTDEGYARKSSYLNLFVKQFWKPAILKEWDRINRKKNESKRIDFLYDFYLLRPNEFVTDYAAESPEEDIAESWTFFVLTDKPLPTSIKYQKLEFFYQFPELIAYRELIRKRVKFIPNLYLESYRNNDTSDKQKN